jgi:alkylation response protein AidB-like acyl-CoA dehydrogenase
MFLAELGAEVIKIEAPQGGDPSRQVGPYKLGEMATRARAARLLTLDAAAIFDRGERCDMEAGMAKYFASEAALENSIESMRIHGAYGYSKEYDIERLYRDAPLTCIGEGTNEMQRIIIARQLIKRNPIS